MNPQVSTAALACVGCVSYLGLDFQPAPAIIACLAAFLVRVPLLNSRTRVIPEASFILLGVLGAFVVVVDRRFGPGLAFGAGVVSGAAAGTMREIGKAVFSAAIRERMQAAARLLVGMPPISPTPTSRPDPAHAEPIARMWSGAQPATPPDMVEQLRKIKGKPEAP